MRFQRFFSFFLLLLCVQIAAAQERLPVTDTLLRNPRLRIRSIIITGNKKTKAYIILREAAFKKGDSIPAAGLSDILENARRNIYNTALFTDVKVVPLMASAFDADISITVKERWYIFPVPQFKPVDRNLAEWIKTNKGDLSRVNYGAKLVHYNLSGRKDQLRIFLLNGYTRNISFSYTAPYSNAALTEGFVVSAGYAQTREITYKTAYNGKQLFFSRKLNPKSTGDFVRNNWFITGGYTLRRGIYNRHLFTIGYNFYHVNDSVVAPAYNPAYFNRGTRRSVGYTDLSYQFQHVDVSNVAYPLSGNSYRITLLKRGLGFRGGINMLSIEGDYNRYFALGKKWYWDTHVSGRLKLPFSQPFINQQALGYGDTYLRGLELYVTDGVAFVLTRSTLRKKIIGFSLPFPFRSRSHSRIPFAFYAKSYADLGYVYTQKAFDTYLNNRLLYTAGLGIDILTLYDINLRVEYSFNQLGQKGLFLHTKSGF